MLDIRFTMAAETGKKRKRVGSKKNKSAWRKKSRIEDIEEFLEDQRLQERTGGLVAEKQDDDLFFVDKQVEPQVSVKRNKKEKKALRCHGLLLPDAVVEPKPLSASVKKRAAKLALSREKNAKPGKKVKVQKVNKTSAPTPTDLWGDPKPTLTDLWANAKPTPEQEEEEEDIVMKRIKGQVKIKVPHHRYKAPSSVPAVTVAAPGASYNPSFDDHQALSQEVEAVRAKHRKEKLRLKRQLDDKFPTAAEAPTMQSWIEEMSAGLENDDDDEEESDVSDSEEVRVSVNPPVRAEDRKSRKQRRKEKEDKIKKLKKIQEKEDRVVDSEKYRLKSLKKALTAREQRLAERRKTRLEAKEKNKDKPKKMSYMRFQEPVAAVKSLEEVEGSLRQLKPVGCLLQERYASLQRRNIVEARRKAKRPKSRLKPKFYEPKHAKLVDYFKSTT